MNAIAEKSAGFVWCLKDDSGNATGFKAEGDPREIYNLSVWERAEDLEFYIWNTVIAASCTVGINGLCRGNSPIS